MMFMVVEMDIKKELESFKTVAIAKGWSIDGETTQTNYRFYSLQTNSGWEMWQAKAQAEVKLSCSITLTCAQLREAFMFGAPDKDDQEQLETEMTIAWSEDGHSGKGYYCYYSELPEEGAIFLDEVIEAQEQSHD